MAEKKEKKVKKAVDYTKIKLWTHYEVSMNFVGRLCGSVPLSTELVPAWIDARKAREGVVKASDKPLDVITEEVLQTLPGEEEQKLMDLITLGFQRTNINGSEEKVLVVRGGTIKSHLKDCANQLRVPLGVTAFKSKVANKVYIEEPFVALRRNGIPITEEDNEYTQTVHTFSAKGPINALKLIRFAQCPVSLNFTMKLLRDPEKFVTVETMDRCFYYGSTHGYGGERSMGEGRYTWTIKEIGPQEPISGIIT